MQLPRQSAWELGTFEKLLIIMGCTYPLPSGRQRIVFRGKDFTKNEMITKGGVENLDDRRKVHLLGLMYNRIQLPKYIDNRQLPTRQFDKKY